MCKVECRRSCWCCYFWWFRFFLLRSQSLIEKFFHFQFWKCSQCRKIHKVPFIYYVITCKGRGRQFLFSFIRVIHKLHWQEYRPPWTPKPRPFTLFCRLICQSLSFLGALAGTPGFPNFKWPLNILNRGEVKKCAYIIYGWFPRDVHFQAAPNRNSSYTSPRWYLFVQWSIEVGWTVVSSRRCYSRKWMSLVYSR